MPEYHRPRIRARGPDPTIHSRAHYAHPRVRRRLSHRLRVPIADVCHPLVDLCAPAGRDVGANTGAGGVACYGVGAPVDGAVYKVTDAWYESSQSR